MIFKLKYILCYKNNLCNANEMRVFSFEARLKLPNKMYSLTINRLDFNSKIKRKATPE